MPDMRVFQLVRRLFLHLARMLSSVVNRLPESIQAVSAVLVLGNTGLENAKENELF